MGHAALRFSIRLTNHLLTADTTRVRRPRATPACLRVFVAVACLWMLSAAPADAATVSGNVLRDETTTRPWAGCDGTTQNVALRYNGVKTTTSCDKVTGAFTMAPGAGTM